MTWRIKRPFFDNLFPRFITLSCRAGAAYNRLHARYHPLHAVFISKKQPLITLLRIDWRSNCTANHLRAAPAVRTKSSLIRRLIGDFYSRPTGKFTQKFSHELRREVCPKCLAFALFLNLPLGANHGSCATKPHACACRLIRTTSATTDTPANRPPAARSSRAAAGPASAIFAA